MLLLLLAGFKEFLTEKEKSFKALSAEKAVFR